jgi:hypothetical protein
MEKHSHPVGSHGTYTHSAAPCVNCKSCPVNEFCVSYLKLRLGRGSSYSYQGTVKTEDCPLYQVLKMSAPDIKRQSKIQEYPERRDKIEPYLHQVQEDNSSQ